MARDTLYSLRAASEFLAKKNPGFAPRLSTLRTWAKPKWRELNAHLVKAQRIPEFIRLPGRRYTFLREGDLLDWISQWPKASRFDVEDGTLRRAAPARKVRSDKGKKRGAYRRRGQDGQAETT